MSKIFQFKQFSVDQSDCGMKVNTDAALLGAIADVPEAGRVLEIGTGTGVIALMLAQRCTNSIIDAIEIDEQAALTARDNFKNSPFSNRLTLIAGSMEDYFSSDRNSRYDVVISNPPYFIDSLKSADASKKLARHTNSGFFKSLLSGAARHLNPSGRLYLILPLDTTEHVIKLLSETAKLAVSKRIMIHSFADSKPYRCILVLAPGEGSAEVLKFVIYESRNVYTHEYRELLKDYLTIF